MVAVYAFQETTTQFLQSYLSVAGLVGLCAQLAFACFPVFQARESARGKPFADPAQGCTPVRWMLKMSPPGGLC